MSQPPPSPRPNPRAGPPEVLPGTATIETLSPSDTAKPLPPAPASTVAPSGGAATIDLPPAAAPQAGSSATIDLAPPSTAAGSATIDLAPRAEADPSATIDVAPPTAGPSATIDLAPGSTASGGPSATVDLAPGSASFAATIDPQAAGPRPPPDKRGAPPAPVVHGYQILSELGRGGMGVVYKARQARLNRTVALKMVLAGAHAGAEQLARFYTEAEAVAHLQHPHIVQIYEVGEHEGLPFFSLEYVDGGSLSDRIDGKPQPVEDAARMVEQLSRAMAYAHQHGIIHRDLKPANVLLTQDGEPKITDFGLAKRLESDASQTRSGTLMGTPNYMAPEQARGEVHEVGPLADVYALGVILYEMLTGRTPFLGASILDTLQQVRNHEPVPPSRLQPSVPRDLETICLKCLEKDPQKRYATAALLAEDLHRFLAGEPILARPVGPAERLWRWCRRNQRVAALSAAVLVLMVSLAIGGPVAAILVSQQKAIAERNAELARDAQHKAEQSAELARQERERAIAAQRVAETNEQKAVAAQKEADQNARSAAEQRGLALEALSTLVTKVQNQLRETPATQKLKQDLLGTGLDGLRKVAKSAQTSRITDGMMAEAHQRMGDIFQSLGQYAEAREQYEASHEIRQAIAGAAPQHLESQRLLALSFSKLGDIRYLEGNASLARQHYEACLRLRETLAAEHGRNAPLLVDLATSYTMLAGVSEPDEAEKYYRQALEIRQALAAQAPEATRANRERDVWILYNRLAALCQKRNELAQAESYYEQALAQARKLADLLPTSIRAKIDLATSQASVALIQNQAGRTAEAREHFGQAIALLAPLAAEDPRNLELQTYYALFLARHGDVVQAAARAEQLRALAPQNHLNLYNVACCYALCAAAVKQAPPAGDSAAAPSEDYAGRAIRTLREAATRGLNGTAGIEGDHDLDAIRDHPEYPALLEALK